MSCAPVKEEFNYTVNYSSECFTMRWDSKKAEFGLPYRKWVSYVQRDLPAGITHLPNS